MVFFRFIWYFFGLNVPFVNSIKGEWFYWNLKFICESNLSIQKRQLIYVGRRSYLRVITSISLAYNTERTILIFFNRPGASQTAFIYCLLYVYARLSKSTQNMSVWANRYTYTIWAKVYSTKNSVWPNKYENTYSIHSTIN